ncbi:MAG: signal peptide peptidase SppA [Fusobacteriaceae bacterium]
MFKGMIWILEKLKNMIVFVGKQILIFYFRLFLLLLLIVFVVISIRKYNINEKINHRKGEYSYIEVDMSKNFSEGNGVFLDKVFKENREYLEFIETLREIEKDEKIKGLIFKLNNFALNSVQSEEIGKILNSIGKKKEIYSYSTGFNRLDYFFASYTKTIMMPPTDSATSILIPYSSEIPYYKDLSDKVGVKFSVVNTGNYKSMGENLISNSMSQYTRENNSMILDQGYNVFLETVSENRNIQKNILQEKIENGDFILTNPQNLADEKLIDKQIYYHNFKKELGDKVTITFEEYQENLVDKKKELDKIGVVFLNGEIRENSIEKGEGLITLEQTENLLKKAMENDEIKGIILRIDSPGGSALASEIIHNMISSYEKRKPIYISMGRVAASGGYYIATAGDKIYLNRNTVTGSIGVVSVIPNFKELTKKIGVKIETIEKGRDANIYSMFEPLNNSKIEVILKSSQRVYLEFKNRVSAARGINLEEVENIAAGRVWLGDKAIEKKLADGIASLEEVGLILAEDLQLEKYQLVKINQSDMKSELFNWMKKTGSLSIFQNSFQNLDFLKLSKEIKSKVKEDELFYKPLYYYNEEILN